MNIKIFQSFIVSLVVLSSTGCTGMHNIEKHQIVKKKPIDENVVLKAYKFKYKPIVGSRHSDARVLLDNGVVLKAWINSYKNKHGSLVASHDLYVRVKKPDFVANYAVLPVSKRTSGLFQSSKKVPFMLSSKEIDRSDIKTNNSIVEYTNSYEDKSNKKIVKKRIKESEEFDESIKRYLHSKKKH